MPDQFNGVNMDTISVRHPKFELECPMSLNWLGGDALRSQFFNSMSMLFPVGERYFMDSLRRATSEIADHNLREQIRCFIGQESMHSRVHANFNRGLQRLGLRNIAEPLIEWRISHSGWLRPLDHVAITAGVEHFTSLFGEATLLESRWLAGGHPELQALWMWHAAEEIEHGSVPLVVYASLGGGYLRRVGWFFYVWLTFSLDVGVQTISNLHRSGSLWRTETWLRGMAFLFGRGGPVRVVLAGIPIYLRPGYVPTLSHSKRMAHAWLAENALRFL
jgi:predicted metal-dependent hydrolase